MEQISFFCQQLLDLYEPFNFNISVYNVWAEDEYDKSR